MKGHLARDALFIEHTASQQEAFLVAHVQR